jgi:nucleotide-binding universal stress UspA family protein
MKSVRPSVVMVGVSESSASAAALRWAADEARRRHAVLRVVHGWDAEPRAPYAPAGAQPTAAQQLAAADGGLTRVLRLALGPELPAELSAELVRGIPERVLIDRSAEADLLVLGSGAPPSTAGRPVGPVVRACLHRARCPVVVVGAPGPGSAGHGRHPAERSSARPQELVSRYRPVVQSLPVTTAAGSSTVRRIPRTRTAPM